MACCCFALWRYTRWFSLLSTRRLSACFALRRQRRSSTFTWIATTTAGSAATTATASAACGWVTSSSSSSSVIADRSLRGTHRARNARDPRRTVFRWAETHGESIAHHSLTNSITEVPPTTGNTGKISKNSPNRSRNTARLLPSVSVRQARSQAMVPVRKQREVQQIETRSNTHALSRTQPNKPASNVHQ